MHIKIETVLNASDLFTNIISQDCIRFFLQAVLRAHL